MSSGRHSFVHFICVYWMWNGCVSIVFVNFWKTDRKFSFILFLLVYMAFVSLSYFRVIFFLLFSSCMTLSCCWSRKINQTHSQFIDIIDMRVVFPTNGYWAEMRLPFSLTKYMRFSVLYFLAFSLSLYLYLYLSCVLSSFFSNIYFHLVDVRVADVLLYVLYVRAILFRVVSCTLYIVDFFVLLLVVSRRRRPFSPFYVRSLFAWFVYTMTLFL